MFRNKSLILLFFVCYGFMSNDEYYNPVTLLNVSIYVEKGALNDVLHVFFIRGELSLTPRSLQYYFFDKLQFTNLRLEVATKTSHVETFEELNTFLSNLVTKEDEMKKIREKVRLTIRPFIFKFKTMDGSQEGEKEDLMKLEIHTTKPIYENYNPYDGSFALLGNYFIWEDSQMRVSVAPLKGKNFIDIFVNRSSMRTQAAIDGGRQITPMALTILNWDKDHSIPTKIKGKFSRFDFIKKEGEWVRAELFETNYGKTWYVNPLKTNDSALESKDLLENHIFSSAGEAATTTPALFTNFITNKFYSTISELVNRYAYGRNQFNNIIYEKNDGLVVVKFIDIKDDPILEESMRGKYTVVAELKESFNDDVFYTNVNPFKKSAYEFTTTPTTTSSSSSSYRSSSRSSGSSHSSSSNSSSSNSMLSNSSLSADKKEGMSIGMIEFITGGVLLLVLVVVGLFGWYYFVKIKGNSSQRIKRFRKQVNR